MARRTGGGERDETDQPEDTELEKRHRDPNGTPDRNPDGSIRGTLHDDGSMSFDTEYGTFVVPSSAVGEVDPEGDDYHEYMSVNVVGSTGDYAEWLLCQAFGWEQAGNSLKGYDARDGQGTRYQIKARRLHQPGTSRLLSAIRDLEGFDVLAGVLFDADFALVRAALIPAERVRARSTFTQHTNSYRFYLRDDMWSVEGVQDVTPHLRALVEQQVA